MNAREFFATLAALPRARRLPIQADSIVESAELAGVEFALARSSDERTLRSTWRARTAGGPDPLLLIADDPDLDSSLRALGPTGAGGPVRVVAAESLLAVLERLPESPLAAVRTLAEELDRLDRTGVPGLTIRGLGTEHLFKTRLPASARWLRLGELGAEAQGEWRDLLRGLGYELEQLPARGYVARHESRPVAVVWPVADAGAFARLDPEGRPPEGAVLDACKRANVPYGLLVAGTRFRLHEAKPDAGAAIGRYVELDAAELPADYRPLLGLLAPEYLAEGGLAEVLVESRAFGATLRKRIDRALRQDVLSALGLELGRWAVANGIDPADDERRSELEAAALTFVFRALFLLYAESAGHLPIAQEAYRPHSLTQIVRDAWEQRDRLGDGTALWDQIATLVRALRTGNPAWSVPGYNGDLFAADGFEGAEVLERASVPDTALGPVLAALGIDPESEDGFDFSGLDIGHLGHIYEGLLSLRLSVADRDYRYDAGLDRYVAAAGDEVEIGAGELLWLTDEGGRKGGGVYYTPEALVRHLVRRGVVPAFEAHLEEVAALARTDPDAAATKLFEFRVLDPACGSAHFLVAVVDELADLVAIFLSKQPLPAVRDELNALRAGAGETYGVGIEDAALLRRLVLKRCVYGVDVSRMGAEIGKISLWLASFVPGLSLTYLDQNVKVGNSLVGVGTAGEVREPGEANGQIGMAAQLLREPLDEAAQTAARLLSLGDRNPDEVAASQEAHAEMERQVAGARRLLNLWVAEPLGLKKARGEVWARKEEILAGAETALSRQASQLARDAQAFHWPLEFPQVFAGDRPGFDAVVGNPPWEEVAVEELAFYARYRPGLRGMSEGERDVALARLKEERPELAERLGAERSELAAMRRFFAGDSGYVGGAGDPDLYKFFCQRYRHVLAPGGVLAVVLPRSAFVTKGSTDFRKWLFTGSTVRRIDFLLNSGRWAFDAEPRYTVSLVVASASTPGAGLSFEVAGVADSASRFATQSTEPGLELATEALGPILEVPLLPSQAAADLLAKLRAAGTPFPHGGGRWRCFPVREFDESLDKRLWKDANEGRELWKGESFDQYTPHGAEARLCPASEQALAKARKPQPGKESLLAADFTVAERRAAQLSEIDGARLAFRDVSRATDSRTVRAALVPPDVFLTNKAPYLVFIDDRDDDRAACLALMNSIVFDWQARRFVETNLNYFILEGLRVPQLSDDAYAQIATAAARLSCPDERFAGFAAATGVEVGPLAAEERERLFVEIDALVAAAWGLDGDDLEVVFADFTLDAVPEGYRERVRARFRELSS